MGYTHGIRWTEEKIRSEILEITKALNLNRMPSNQEIKNIMGDTSLTNAIRRHGGYYEWANKLELDMKNCETKFGKRYERVVKEILETKGYEVEQMSIKHPYDLLVNKSIKIDVKAARRYYYTDNSYFYTFNLEKKNATCDIYVCLTVNEEVIEKTLVIPSKFLNKTQLTLGINSIYDKYINKWDYIKQFNDFYKSIV